MGGWADRCRRRDPRFLRNSMNSFSCCSRVGRSQKRRVCCRAKSLYDQAVGGNVTAAIWWTKARMRWSETHIVKDSDETELERISDEELAKALEERANKLGIKINLSQDQFEPR